MRHDRNIVTKMEDLPDVFWRFYSDEEGIALLIVLWVLAVLMVVALSFSFVARTETHSTFYFKEALEKKFSAEAGLERGIIEIFYGKRNISSEGSGIWRADGTIYTGQTGDRNYTVSIMDESGKVDINATTDVILKGLLLHLGLQGETVDTIVDSVMDWKDQDELHRLNGAESDYYMSLPSPYKAKNTSFDTLEELLMVKGITPEILYGNEERKGIIRFLTVNSKRTAININTAPMDVLMAVPGITSDIADKIISYRESKKITNMEEVKLSPESTQYFVSGIESDTFTVESTGYKNDMKTGYTIKAVISIIGTDRYRYVYYKSPANINQ